MWAVTRGRRLKSHDIAVATRKGDVQLSGFVDNQMQIDRAIEIARSIEGVSTLLKTMLRREFPERW